MGNERESAKLPEMERVASGTTTADIVSRNTEMTERWYQYPTLEYMLVCQLSCDSMHWVYGDLLSNVIWILVIGTRHRQSVNRMHGLLKRNQLHPRSHPSHPSQTTRHQRRRRTKRPRSQNQSKMASQHHHVTKTVLH